MISKPLFKKQVVIFPFKFSLTEYMKPGKKGMNILLFLLKIISQFDVA